MAAEAKVLRAVMTLSGITFVNPAQIIFLTPTLIAPDGTVVRRLIMNQMGLFLTLIADADENRWLLPHEHDHHHH